MAAPSSSCRPPERNLACSSSMNDPEQPTTVVLDHDYDMTIIGHVKTMTISHFKAHLSEELRKVRRGARLVISDRDTPIAEVVPYRTGPALLDIRAPRVTPFNVPRSTLRIEHDPLEYLLEERATR
jgi:prevent-host-death family protein